MAYQRGPRKNQESFTSLRTQETTEGLSTLQAAYLGAFVVHVLEHEMAVYVASLPSGRGVRVRVFNGDDKYEDTLATSEDWGPIFDGYAKSLGGQTAWRAKAAALHKRHGQEAPGGAKDGPA